MKAKVFSIFLFLLISSKLLSQGTISGKVLDADNGESIIGCNIILQGTTIGTVTDFDGNYTLQNVPAGSYNIIFSFISYDKHIQKVEVTKTSNVVINVNLKSSSQLIQEVQVVAKRRSDTELSMLMATKQGLTIANGITSQQISRSQDKDASEVIRRIPGVTIRDGKFVIVRGLTERYNSVWLNGSSTPSSESDVRAFSFDVIPSGQIDNILIYKTPAPELPADFAGAMINVKTKSLIDRNSITVSASLGYNQLSTGKTFYSSEGSKTDWLGYDKTVRVLPSGLPSTADYRALFDQTDDAKINQINIISKSFNTIMTPFTTTAKPDADLQFSFNQRFRVGDVSVGTITALGYNSSNTAETSFRAAYVSYPDTSYRYKQKTYQSKVRLTALSNWTFTFGNNQRIEFRNLFNNMGANRTVLKEGFDFYAQSNDRAYELGYESRATYSGQLAGTHKFFSEKTALDWVVGYAYADKNQPDLRRVKFTSRDNEPETQFQIGFNSTGSSEALGRIYMKNKERIVSGGLNLSQKLSINDFHAEIKAGGYYERKSRTFTNRTFNYIKSTKSKYRYALIDSYNNTPAFNDAMFASIDEIFDTKIDYSSGLVLLDVSQKADAYDATNQLFAGYLAANIPVAKWLNVYAGIRVENNDLQLNGYKRDGTDNTPENVPIDTLNVYPSINATFSINPKMMIRLAGGKTVNRPEFREVSTFTFYNFEDNVTIYGNPELKNSYVSNFDARYEWYPAEEEIISVGVFYKQFIDPIESKILYTGSGWNYTFHNAEKASSYGLEFDARKRLHEFEKAGAWKFLSNITFVVNASIIKSIIKTDSITDGESERVLQGQSPYIINVGAYYNDIKYGWMGSVMFNKAGERIAVVGDIDIPHVYEMPFNSLDFTIEKKLFKIISLKFGVKNALDSEVVFQQNQKYPNANGGQAIREQVTNRYKPGRQFKLGVSVTL